MENRLIRLLKEKRVLLADGATATNLYDLGLSRGTAPELWNVDQPEKVAQHYRSMIDAGSDIVLSNTFGGSACRLTLEGAQSRVHELNMQAVHLLKEQVVESAQDVVIAGSVGPTGLRVGVDGELSRAQATAIFTEQVQALNEAGVDALWIETLSSYDEALAAVTAAKTTGLPVVVTVTLGQGGRTMSGMTVEDIANTLPKLHDQLLAYGINCGTGPFDTIVNLKALSVAVEPSGQKGVLVAKSNCGFPESKNGVLKYSETPESMAQYARSAMEAGARIVGGCCGTSPAHIVAMRRAIDQSMGLRE